MRGRASITIPDDARKQAIASIRQYFADAKSFFDERAADLGALCHHEEFPYWPAATRRKA